MKKIIRVLILSLFLVFPFGQLTRLPIPHPSIRIYLHDIIISLILISWLFTKPKKLPPLTKPITLFVSAGLLSLIFALPKFTLQELAISSLYLIRWLTYSSLYFVLSDKTLKLKLPLKKLLLFSGLALAIFGLAQYIFLPDTRFLKLLNWDDHLYRLIATLLDPAFTALIILLGLILLLTQFPKTRFKPLFTFLLLISLLLTYSRSTYLALLASLFTYSLIKKNFKPILIGLGLLLISLPLLPRPYGEGVKLERLYSISNRLDNYQQGITIFKQSPLFGIGFNTLRYHQRNLGLLGQDWQVSHAAAGLDSSLLFVLATTGLIGLTTYLYFLKHIWSISDTVKISLSAILVHSLFNNSLFYPWVMIWLWVLLGMV